MSMAIPAEELRKTDLSLFIYFVVLVEERTVAKAAARLELTPTALTRAIQKLREIFRDELLVRTADGYLPTPRGQELLSKLAEILPKIDDVITGTPFNPSITSTNFNITAADSLSYFYGTVLARRRSATPNITFSFSTYGEDRYGDLEKNAQDIVLDAQYKALGGSLRSEVLFEEELVCAVAKESSLRDELDLKSYLELRHVAITTLHDIQAIPDLAFARDGLKRRSPFRVASFAAGLALVQDSDLVATVPLSLAVMLMNTKTTRLVKAPVEVATPYRYIMVWHKRQEKDERHLWLRKTLRTVTSDLTALIAAKEKAIGRVPRRFT